MKDIRIAAVVCRSPVNQVFKTLRRMAVWVDKARDEGVDILCFPEMNVTGYSIQKEIRKVAEPIPGPITETLMELAAGGDMVLLAGMAEKGKKGRIYSSHLVVRHDGEVGVYRKIHIAPPEEGFFSRGNRIPLFKARGVNFGIQLCYDAHFPELSTAMAVKGADIVFFPHASPRGTSNDKYRSWMRHLPARAFDNGVYVVACNPMGDNGEGLEYPGVALAIGPDGCVVAKRLGKRECLLVVDLKKSALDAVRSHRMRYFLPHRRPTLFRIPGALKSHKA